MFTLQREFSDVGVGTGVDVEAGESRNDVGVVLVWKSDPVFSVWCVVKSSSSSRVPCVWSAATIGDTESGGINRLVFLSSLSLLLKSSDDEEDEEDEEKEEEEEEDDA